MSLFSLSGTMELAFAPQHHEQIFGIFNKLNPDIEGTGIGFPS